MKIPKKYGSKIMNWKAEGYSNPEIADKLNILEEQTKYTERDVRYFLEKADIDAKQYYAKKGELEQQNARKYFDTLDRINQLNKSVWEIYYPTLELIKSFQEKLRKANNLSEKEVSSLSKLLNALSAQTKNLLQIIEHVDKILGKISNEKVNITYNIQDLSRKVVQYANILQKRFGLKIPKKKLKEKYIE